MRRAGVAVFTALVFAALLAVGLPGAGAASSQPALRLVTIHVYSSDNKMIKGPDGKYHDAFTPYDIVLHPSATVQLKFINHDDMPHTFTVPALKLNVTVKGGSHRPNGTFVDGVTTYTFTPSREGAFRWYCALPCDNDNGQWAMKVGRGGPSKEGFMSGTITVQDGGTGI